MATFLVYAKRLITVEGEMIVEADTADAAKAIAQAKMDSGELQELQPEWDMPEDGIIESQSITHVEEAV